MHTIFKRLGAGAAAALVLCGSAVAGDWRLASISDPDGAAIAVDVESIKGAGDVRTAQLVQAPYRSQQMSSGSYDYIVSDVEMNCAAKTYGFRTMAAYNLEGALIARETNATSRAILPGSTMDYARAVICSGERQGLQFADALAFAKAVRSGELGAAPATNQT